MEYDYPPQDHHWPNMNPIFNPQQSFVEIEDMKYTISRQLQQLDHLHQRQQQIQRDAFTEMEQQMHMEASANPEIEAQLEQLTQVWKVQMQESQALRETQQHALYNMHANFWQETMPDPSGWSNQGLMRPQKHKQTPKGPQNAGQHVSKGSGTYFPDDRLGNSSATTLMVRNIPVRYTQEMLLKEWPNKGNYDFLYLPICIKKRCNTSFAFINFISPEAAREFAEKWHHERLLFFSARKPLDISLADLQGLEKNLLQCMNNKTSRIRNVRFQPAVFKGTERVSVEKVMKDMREKMNPNQNIEELELEDMASSGYTPVESL